MKPEIKRSDLVFHIIPDKKRIEEDSHKARSINFWGNKEDKDKSNGKIA